MKYVNRRDLEDGLFCFQREDVVNERRWYVSFKLKGYKRVYKALGEMSAEQAEKLSRRELMQAEQTIDEFGVREVFYTISRQILCKLPHIMSTIPLQFHTAFDTCMCCA